MSQIGGHGGHGGHGQGHGHGHGHGGFGGHGNQLVSSILFLRSTTSFDLKTLQLFSLFCQMNLKKNYLLNNLINCKYFFVFIRVIKVIKEAIGNVRAETKR